MYCTETGRALSDTDGQRQVISGAHEKLNGNIRGCQGNKVIQPHGAELTVASRLTCVWSTDMETVKIFFGNIC